MPNEVITKDAVDCVSRMAKAFAMSGLFGFKSEADAFALMTIAQANGLHPAKAAERYHIIQGRPAMKSEAMLSSFQESGGKIRWLKRTNTECVLHLEHPQGGELDVKWDIARAKASGLADKNTWKQFPAHMLSARCVSEGVRALFPACLCGMYTPEEVSDFSDDGNLASLSRKKAEQVEAEVMDATEAEAEEDKCAGPNLANTANPAEQEKPSERDQFLTAMKGLCRTNNTAYSEAMANLKYGSAKDVPEERMRTVFAAVQLAVQNAVQNMEADNV